MGLKAETFHFCPEIGSAAPGVSFVIVLREGFGIDNYGARALNAVGVVHDGDWVAAPYDGEFVVSGPFATFLDDQALAHCVVCGDPEIPCRCVGVLAAVAGCTIARRGQFVFMVRVGVRDLFLETERTKGRHEEGLDML